MNDDLMRGMFRDALMILIVAAVALYVFGHLLPPKVKEALEKLFEKLKTVWEYLLAPVTWEGGHNLDPDQLYNPTDQESGRARAASLCAEREGVETGIFSGIGNPFVQCGDGTGWDLNSGDMIWGANYSEPWNA